MLCQNLLNGWQSLRKLHNTSEGQNQRRSSGYVIPPAPEKRQLGNQFSVQGQGHNLRNSVNSDMMGRQPGEMFTSTLGNAPKVEGKRQPVVNPPTIQLNDRAMEDVHRENQGPGEQEVCC